MNIFRNKKLPLIDLNDYEGELLMNRDKGWAIMPPPPINIMDKRNYNAEEWERIQRNYRLAVEIYKRYKE